MVVCRGEGDGGDGMMLFGVFVVCFLGMFYEKVFFDKGFRKTVFEKGEFERWNGQRFFGHVRFAWLARFV